MQHKTFNTLAAVLTGLFITITSLGAKAGGPDNYEIYLNSKLLLKQSVEQPLTLKSLQLNQANANDELVIHYRHCGGIAKGRKIAIKDEKGNIIKEWKFADASGSHTGMKVAVKDLLQLEKKYAHNQLSIFYASEQLPKGRMLTGIQLGNKATSWRQANHSQVVASALSFNIIFHFLDFTFAHLNV